MQAIPNAIPNPLPSLLPGPLLDPKVNAVIDRLEQARKRPSNGGPLSNRSNTHDPYAYADIGFSIHPDQGNLIYLLCRAVRDNGGGVVIGSELVPAKAFAAWRNLTEAGLAHLVDIRQGDARDTLRDLGGPVDFMLVDGWPGPAEPSLARQVIEIVAPQIRVGGLVMNDNAEPDYLAYIRNPANGFRSMTLPIKGATELSVKVN